MTTITATTNARDRFIQLLRQDILQIDAADLDFGLYRVLNHRRAEIEAFLTQALPDRIIQALAGLPGTASDDEAARIFNALYTFLSRYCDEGDFLPRPRRGRFAAAYSVPYDGSDTQFHWATKGSHYVKSDKRLVVQAADVQRDNARWPPVGCAPRWLTSTRCSGWATARSRRRLMGSASRRLPPAACRRLRGRRWSAAWAAPGGRPNAAGAWTTSA